ncbi:unnamed protein product [Mesocestoides corti]|uniref:Lebercilin domain-containing protein n=1 Tax=Mesocestoides corti TaxID=53468 RepID=A0A0R3UFF9_MESCO|nr:unnamed protein product [Mesocestoides corti]
MLENRAPKSNFQVEEDRGETNQAIDSEEHKQGKQAALSSTPQKCPPRCPDSELEQMNGQTDRDPSQPELPGEAVKEVKPERQNMFELCKEKRLWEDLFGNRPTELDDILGLSKSQYLPSSASPVSGINNSTDDRKTTAIGAIGGMKTVVDLQGGSRYPPVPLDEVSHCLKETAGNTRRHGVIRNPLENLEMEEVQL